MALIVLNPPKTIKVAEGNRSLKGVKVAPQGFTFSDDRVVITNLEGFISTVNTNPNLVPITSIIRAWKSLGIEDDVIILELNNVHGLGTIIKKSIDRGTPDASLSPLEILSQKVFERVIDYIKKVGRDACVNLLGKLYNAFGNNKYIGPFIKFIIEKAGAEICSELIELLDREVFRKYVVPFINDLINFELISREVGGFSFYGATPIEKAEIARILASLKQVTDKIKQFAKPLVEGGFNPLSPPSEGSEDFSGKGKDDDEDEEASTKKIFLFGTLALGCVAVYAIVNRRDDAYYGAPPYAYPPPQANQYYPPQYFNPNIVR